MKTKPDRSRLMLLLLGILAVFGAFFLGQQLSPFLAALFPPSPAKLGSIVAAGHSVPAWILPGPPRPAEQQAFHLTAENAQLMRGTDDPENERWADIAGNMYATDFCRSFSYHADQVNGARVYVRISPRGPRFSGRLEARGLKPNFAYQLKLRGIFSDRRHFEEIGYLGRWRLPGVATNYSDSDYQDCENKAEAEAYILFDFFVTDAKGDAIRNFSLDSSLHVLWNASRQGHPGVPQSACVAVRVFPQDPKIYARPKQQGTLEYIWAEREHLRYPAVDTDIRLSPGHWQAELVLTEESFHAVGRDGGWWATVYALPVAFTITGALPRTPPGKASPPRTPQNFYGHAPDEASGSPCP